VLATLEILGHLQMLAQLRQSLFRVVGRRAALSDFLLIFGNVSSWSLIMVLMNSRSKWSP
jgi:hypothetical protein